MSTDSLPRNYDLLAFTILAESKDTPEETGLLDPPVFEKYLKFLKHYLAFTYNKEKDRLYKETIAAQRSKDKEYIKDVLKETKNLESLKPKENRILSPNQLKALLEDVILIVGDYKEELETENQDNLELCNATLEYLKAARSPIEDSIQAAILMKSPSKRRSLKEFGDSGSFKGTDNNEEEQVAIEEDNNENETSIKTDPDTEVAAVNDVQVVEKSESAPVAPAPVEEKKVDAAPANGCNCTIM